MIELKQFEVHYIDYQGVDRFVYLSAFNLDHAKIQWEEEAALGDKFISAKEWRTIKHDTRRDQ